jgi:hypothetical protein
MSGMPRRLIGASELGDYRYCQRSWWLRRAVRRGARGDRPHPMAHYADGVHQHRRHGASVAVSRWLLIAGTLLGLMALLVLGWWR